MTKQDRMFAAEWWKSFLRFTSVRNKDARNVFAQYVFAVSHSHHELNVINFTDFFPITILWLQVNPKILDASLVGICMKDEVTGLGNQEASLPMDTTSNSMSYSNDQ